MNNIDEFIDYLKESMVKQCRYSPVKASFEITLNCNLSCVHCYNHGNSTIYIHSNGDVFSNILGKKLGNVKKGYIEDNKPIIYQRDLRQTECSSCLSFKYCGGTADFPQLIKLNGDMNQSQCFFE